ncbi:MAG: amidohydrolase family protein [Anaerolineae bacterium]|nr:amidohydrolase family protein [Anaerolineae bacterium]
MAKSAILAAGFVDLSDGGIEYHTGECLVIEDGRMVGFEAVGSLPAEVTVIDRSADYCIPGLVDAGLLAGLIVSEDGKRPNRYGESVWLAKQAAELWVRGGTTSAASMGAYDRMDLDLRASIGEGRINGPRVYPALSPLVPAGATNFHLLYGVREVHGADEARRAVRELIKQGAERIVVYADVPLEFHPDPAETSRHRLTFSVDELSEITAQAKQAGCFVHAQAISAAAIENCIQAGVRSIGCAFGLSEAHLAGMVAAGTALAPNLALGATISEMGAAAGFSAGAINMVSKQRISPSLLMKAQAAGVEIICATNTAFLAGDVRRECYELHKAGMSTSDVLRAATQNGAKALKPYVESGFFRSHYYADLLFVKQNPIEGLQSLSEISGVMLEGTLC